MHSVTANKITAQTLLTTSKYEDLHALPQVKQKRHRENDAKWAGNAVGDKLHCHPCTCPRSSARALQTTVTFQEGPREIITAHLFIFQPVRGAFFEGRSSLFTFGERKVSTH